MNIERSDRFYRHEFKRKKMERDPLALWLGQPSKTDGSLVTTVPAAIDCAEWLLDLSGALVELLTTVSNHLFCSHCCLLFPFNYCFVSNFCSFFLSSLFICYPFLWLFFLLSLDSSQCSGTKQRLNSVLVAGCSPEIDWTLI